MTPGDGRPRLRGRARGAGLAMVVAAVVGGGTASPAHADDLRVVSGTVRYASGAPAPAVVGLVPVGSDGAEAVSASTDGQGRWMLAAPAGRYQVWATQAGRTLWYPGTAEQKLAAVLDLTAGAPSAPLPFTFPTPGRLAVHVTSPTGAPLSGVCLEGLPRRQCTTATGWARFRDVPLGRVTLSGRSRNAKWFVAPVGVDVSGTEEVSVEVRAAPTATLSGTVRGADGKPVAGICPQVRYDGQDLWADAPTTCSDAAGRWKVRGLVAGALRVHLQGEDVTDPAPASFWYPQAAWAEAATRVTLTAGQSLALPLTALRPWGRITGRVLDPQGRPVAGASVQFGSLARTQGDVGAAEHQTRTDADGRYVLGKLPAASGPVLVTSDAPPLAFTWSGGVAAEKDAAAVGVRWGATTVQDVTMLAEAPLTVTLRGLVPGDSYDLTPVDAQGREYGFRATYLSDASPSATLHGLPPGPVRLMLHRYGLVPSPAARVVFYPAAPTSASATDVLVSAGGTSMTWDVP
ncbi:MAG: carboxypeptidase-like regulatory domain-containing protein [Kineosporiaceae bacterium]